jgi:phospholipase C
MSEVGHYLFGFFELQSMALEIASIQRTKAEAGQQFGSAVPNTAFNRGGLSPGNPKSFIRHFRPGRLPRLKTNCPSLVK